MTRDVEQVANTKKDNDVLCFINARVIIQMFNTIDHTALAITEVRDPRNAIHLSGYSALIVVRLFVSPEIFIVRWFLNPDSTPQACRTS